jgi:hypothetical protein
MSYERNDDIVADGRFLIGQHYRRAALGEELKRLVPTK